MSLFSQKFANIANARREAVWLIINEKIDSEERVIKIVRQMCSKYHVSCLDLKKSGLIEAYREMLANTEIEENKQFEQLMIKRKVRTQSGVSVISVMTKPLSCPGKCIYCPTQDNMPKSYLDNQPAAMRGVMFDFDPYEQVRARLMMLDRMGHDISKNEVIILGGTFSAHPARYQELFIKRIYDAFNNYSGGKVLGSRFKVLEGEKIQNSKYKTQNIADDLEGAKRINETAGCRMIGLTIETRPDWVTPTEVKRLRYFGVTRVELGVQSVFDDVLQGVKRGHDVAEIKKATNLLRQAGFKIVYHIMPGLPGSNVARDIEMFKLLFSDPGFFPDHLKIYPTVVLKDSQLYKIWQKGGFKPYKNKQVVEVLKTAKKIVPPWVRIVRIMRDIPQESIVDGVKVSNLRQQLEEAGAVCQCIRCREPKGKFVKELKVVKRSFEVLGGQEVFLSYESTDEKNILALARLFIPDKKTNSIVKIIREIEGCALIRELHTYGTVIGVDQKSDNKSQHRGLGKKLMIRAESEAKKYGFKKMAVIAGIGVREYYNKIGYKLVGEYMVKYLV
ncbi:MAG: tRNA uridine(34) 5-carboxymethylaminomethyl modification radical SAM/GNAT enzyme Elp3 [Patescibacteria group bacterium]